MNVVEEVKRIEKDIIKWRRDLHKIPELNLNLPKTSRYVQEILKEMNIKFHTLVNGNAIVAVIEGTKPFEGRKKTIGIRADMDGLPIQEETGLEFSSTHSGCMHACGHDGHTAILLGAAKVLSENKDKFSGNIKLLFQPGEEYPGGAKPMIEEGSMENPKVDAVIGLHNGQINEKITSGSIAYKDGCMMASMDRFLIKVIGIGCHGAYPQLGVDPIVVSSEIVLALQKIISREINTNIPSILSVCKINGGFSQNIIPDVVELEGTVRATDVETRKFIAKRIEEVVKGICLAARADYKIEYDFKYPPVINNKEFNRVFIKAAKKILDEKNIIEMPTPVMGGEDMAFFLEKAPGTFFFLSNPKVYEDGKIYSHHSSKFDLDESYFYIGTSLFVQTALDYLNEVE
ncbi:MAG: N-acyl-L-amino acid amidohydrolase [Fusobacteriales bacterium]|nr:MAG: N-acyl-L-amino acid amidohydrolase [Fusobacteriales bacterium]